MSREAWLSGPVDGIPPLLMPVAHALLQAKEDLHGAAAGLTVDELWQRPAGAASIGFHLHHIAGSTDRLLTYARGEQLNEEQMAALREEGSPGGPGTAADLLECVDAAFDEVIADLKATPEGDLLKPREVGRARLPSNVLGLLFHIAEHTQRHTGQTITTCKIIRGGDREEAALAEGRA